MEVNVTDNKQKGLDPWREQSRFCYLLLNEVRVCARGNTGTGRWDDILLAYAPALFGDSRAITNANTSRNNHATNSSIRAKEKTGKNVTGSPVMYYVEENQRSAPGRGVA